MLISDQGSYPPQCPVVGALEDTGWDSQCPMYNQWSVQQPQYGYCQFPAQDGFTKKYHRPDYPAQFQSRCYPNQFVYPRVQNDNVQLNLPCQGNQQWSYENCYNINGQPCQYTDVVDLEDFMNNEKRKEKSRMAARCRRTKEMQIFAELTAALPAKKEEVEQLDKASVMRLAIAYLRVRDVVALMPEVSTEELKMPKNLEDVSSELSYMKALDGFVMVLSQPGDMVYCSENISEHLGVNQMEIMGQSVFEFSHPCDHDEMRDALRCGAGARRDLLLRLKCTITGKGRNVHLKSASYKVIHVTGHMLMPSEKSEDKSGDEKRPSGGMLVAVGRPIPHPANIEIPLDSKTFLTKHSLDMKFTYVDETLSNTLGYEHDDLVGKSLFDYHHASDTASLTHQFKSLFSKGQCETGQYRFLAKAGGFAWIQTQATLITDKQQKPISVVCVNYIVSGIECKDDVFAVHQLQHAELKPTVPAPNPVLPYDLPNGAIVGPVVLPEEERPIPVTELIFAPRKKEMNKGFLMFSQDEGLTMLKDEPDDLTHLAPTAGDACIPLESNPFDMFDEFILSDNYCSLLGDDLGNGSPVDSLVADPLLMSSPDTRESDSSCEPGSLLTEISLDTYDGRTSEGELDDGKSPFIPLTDEQLMWGALPENVSLAKPQPKEPQNPTTPSLQRLLAATPTGPPPQDVISNIYPDQGIMASRGLTTWDTGVKRVMKQDEEPNAKRSKRSASPPQSSPASQSSSVLMNLLDLPQPPPLGQQKIGMNINYQLMNCRKLNPRDPIVVVNRPINGELSRQDRIAILNNIQLKNIKTHQKIISVQNNQIPQLTIDVAPDINIPSNRNVNMYPLNKSPYSPTISPLISPVHKGQQLISPNIMPKSLSPIGVYNFSPGANKMPPNIALQSTNDPYLTNKLPSPNYPAPIKDMLLDQDVPIPSPDFWNDGDIIHDTSDILAALDYVKLN